jgi:hypothetical protein
VVEDAIGAVASSTVALSAGGAHAAMTSASDRSSERVQVRNAELGFMAAF